MIKLKERFGKSYNNFLSKISVRDIFYGTGFLFLFLISAYNALQINKINSFLEEPTLEELKIDDEKHLEEEKGISFLIMKEEPKQYNLEGLLKRYPKAEPYIQHINKAVEKYQHIWPIDNLTVFAKIRYESEFNQFAISPKCALGPSQLMSYTAKDLGLRVPKELEPEGFYKARFLDRKANTYRSLAINAFLRKEDDLAKHYRSIYEKNKEIADALYLKCKKDIRSWLKGKTKEELKKTPFDIESAIDAGTKHFTYCFKVRKGDFREASCVYNAGLGPVKKAEGIPYIRESVNYQNKITNFHKYWGSRLKTIK